MFWSKCVSKSTEFFRVCIMSELLGRWYTRCRSICSDNEPSATNNLHLTLQLQPNHSSSAISNPLSQDLPDPSTLPSLSELHPESEQMIACDNSNYKIEWFHIKCLKIKTIPKGKWYCPSCRTLPECRQTKKG